MRALDFAAAIGKRVELSLKGDVLHQPTTNGILNAVMEERILDDGQGHYEWSVSVRIDRDWWALNGTEAFSISEPYDPNKS